MKTLTIPATLEYNGTDVVCVALFDDGSPSEETPPVSLLVITTEATESTMITSVTGTVFLQLFVSICRISHGDRL